MTALAHNGGLGQVNLNYLQTGGDYPFINHLKTSQAWTLADHSGLPDPDTLDSDGYPTSISHGGVVSRFFIPSKHSRGGRYLIRWTGNCTVAMASSFTFVSASAGVTVSGFGNSQFASSLGSGRVVIEEVDESVNLAIFTTGCSDLQFLHEDDEALYDAGERFGVAFKAAFAEGHIGVIRFLNWTDTNLTTASDWASRKPETYFSYSAHEMRGSHYNVTGGSGTAYTMVAPSGWTGLADKVWVIARFHTAGTGTATLNVGGTGAKPLLNWACSPLESGSYPTADGLGHCFYDATLDAWIKVGGGDIAHGDAGLNNGCPWEVLLQLCAETGTHPHFCFPHYALTPPSDLVSEVAAHCEANAPAWMCPVYEPSNEVWNTFFGFNQTFYAQKVATALGWGASNNHDRWYGYALSCLGQDVAAAYSTVKANVKTQALYRVVGGIMTAGSLAVDGQQADRFESTDFIDGGFSPPVGYDQDPAKEWATDIAPANYFTPPIYNGAVETAMASEFDGVRATVDIDGFDMTIRDFNGSPAVTGTMQVGTYLRGVGIAGAMVQPGTKVVSGSGSNWVLDKDHDPVENIGVIGGLDWSIVDDYAEHIYDAGDFGLPKLSDLYAQVKIFALAHGMYVTCGYEGGWSPDLSGAATDLVNCLRSAASYSDKIAKITLQAYEIFYDLTDETFTAHYGSNYLLSGSIYLNATTGVIAYGSVWAVLQDIYQNPRPPAWIAMKMVNKGDYSALAVNN